MTLTFTKCGARSHVINPQRPTRRERSHALATSTTSSRTTPPMFGTNDKHVASDPEGDFAAIPARSDLHIVANLPTDSTLNNATLRRLLLPQRWQRGAWWV